MAACRARAFRQQTVLDEGAGVLTASARPIFTRRDGVNVLPTAVVAVCRQTKVNSLKHTPPALEAIAVTQRIQPATIHLQIPRHNYVHELRL